MQKSRNTLIFALAIAGLLVLSWARQAGLSHGTVQIAAPELPMPLPALVNSPPLDVGFLVNTGGLFGNVPGYYDEVFINEEQEGRMSHVSSLAPLRGGEMAAVWYSGSREGARDVKVYLSILSNSASAADSHMDWSDSIPIADRASAMRELGTYVKKVGNPMLSVDEEGRLWLFYSTVFAGGWSGASLNYKLSSDHGLTWGKSQRLILGPLFNLTNNVKNRALALRGGGFLLPAYHELIRKRSELVRLMPDGRYTKTRMTRSGRAIQPSLVEKDNERLGAFLRNMAHMPEGVSRRVLYAESPDMGLTWSGLMETTLENPNAGLDVMDTEYGLLAVLNNQTNDRHRLELMLSPDGGRTWNDIKVLEDEEGKEYSYPSLGRGSDGLFHLTYTHNRKRIKHVSFDALWLRWRMGEGS